MINKNLNRAELTELFSLWEKRLPVENWEVAGILLWPLIKKCIYFSLFVDSTSKKKKKENSSVLKRFTEKIQKHIKARLYLKSLRLKRVTFLFCSSYEQRIVFKGKEFNRFLEPLMDYLEAKEFNSYLLEYPFINKTKSNRPDRIIDVRKLLVLYSTSKNKDAYSNKFANLEGLNSFIEDVYKETGIDQDFLKKRILKNILAIKSWEGVFVKIIKLTKPQFVVGLVYYSNPIYGLNLAANKLGIPSIDLQHGGLGTAHPAYNFSKVPNEGYNILPKVFWAWNDSSYKDILNWSKNTPHKVINGGNPWIGYLSKKMAVSGHKDFSSNNKPVILFTLQPIGDVISSYFLEVIAKTKDRFNWWLRFHPRMTEIEKNAIVDRFKRNDSLEAIEYEYSTSSPLPVAINECDLHISLSSGSVIEAAMMNKYSLIISETGANYYANIIADGWAESCLSENVDVIIEKIEASLNKKSLVNKEDFVDYRRTLDALIKE
ncbi:hypothetical protein [Salegentibacter mishustinae]|uniref:hypothetical protein n=1 Tax=Salegentibacter mishustinae TaxID=270918 RepID=UPI002492C77C|nr:hypothetical protein [Salegentibacter mishustinae]